MNEKDPTILEVIFTFLAGLVPGALGAGVAVALDHTLTWLQRFVAISVGIVVSYFVRELVHEIWPQAGPFVLQGASFSVGMVAYKAVPSFVENASSTVGSIPGELWKSIKAKIGLK